MRENHLWNCARGIQIQTSDEIIPGFDVGFDQRICDETKDILMRFAYWVEDHFAMPVTLWVDVKYNHYLRDESGKRVGYKFYWVDFADYPVFTSWDDIPVVELPARMEHQSEESILMAFIEAISMYFIWLRQGDPRAEKPDREEMAEVLHAYLAR